MFLLPLPEAAAGRLPQCAGLPFPAAGGEAAAGAPTAPQGFPHRQSRQNQALLGQQSFTPQKVVGGPSQEPGGGKTQRHAEAHPKKSLLAVTAT